MTRLFSAWWTRPATSSEAARTLAQLGAKKRARTVKDRQDAMTQLLREAIATGQTVKMAERAR